MKTWRLLLLAILCSAFFAPGASLASSSDTPTLAIGWGSRCAYVTVGGECERDEAVWIVRGSCDGTQIDLLKCERGHYGAGYAPGNIAAGDVIYARSITRGCAPAGVTVPPCDRH